MLTNGKSRRWTRATPTRAWRGSGELIGCEWVQPVVLGGELTIWVDEEERLKLPKPGFSLKDIPMDFAGNGVLLGGDADQVKPCHVPANIVAMGVKWLAPGEVTPPGRPEIHFI